MPQAIKRHKLRMLEPRVAELQPRIKMLGGKTLKERQQETGRTLALNGAAWRKLRASVLSEQPLCPECSARGEFVLAKDVDHRDNDPSNNERSNLVGLCHMHHSQKTRRWMNEKSPATDGHEPSSSTHAHRRN